MQFNTYKVSSFLKGVELRLKLTAMVWLPQEVRVITIDPVSEKVKSAENFTKSVELKHQYNDIVAAEQNPNSFLSVGTSNIAS